MPISTINSTTNYIRRIQTEDGAIPWFEGGIVDPWDHVEAAMGLTVGGAWSEARKAYRWLAYHQKPAGYWLAAYRGGAIVDGTRAETNFVAYFATGVWHYYLVTQDKAFLKEMWPTVMLAMDFVLLLQSPHGEIFWALDTRTGINRDALITGCSSIYKSLECTINIAHTLNLPTQRWADARTRLGEALRHKPERFDRSWASKSRYSMDWFYPVLTGVIEGSQAVERLDQRWSEFVEDQLGCRCVADEPWVTVAETCELTMALVATKQLDKAQNLFAWIAQFQAPDGSWWTGYAIKDKVLWPDERPTWTAGSIILAADALAKKTKANKLFTSVNLASEKQIESKLAMVDSA